MKKILILTLAFLPAVLFGQSNVQNAVNSFAEYWAFENAGISITVKNTVDNSLVASHNSDLALSPASTVKLFSTATAIEVLGKDYRPKTELYTDGKVNSSGVLIGNIYLRALGDPTLGSKYFNADGKENQYLLDWVSDIKALGIKEIQGRIIVDGSAFGYQGCPEGWTWGDMGNYYGAGPSAIIINDNILNYYFKTAGIGTNAQLVKTVPEVADLKLVNDITGQKVSGDNSLIYGAPFSLNLYASGSLPYGRSEYKVNGSLPDPEKQLSNKLYFALKDGGISISDGFDFNRNRVLQGILATNYSKLSLLKTWEGQTVEDIAFHTNMKSVNIFAEQFVCLLGYEKTGLGSTSNGIDVIEKHWKDKLNIKNLHIKDGSGLSRSNAISSNQFCGLLNYMSKSDQYSVFKSTLPVAGQSGTLANVGKGQLADGRVFAKSGTMSRVKSYAGYVSTKTNKLLSFSIIVNNYNCSNAAVVDKMETIFNAMAVY
jgi:D-alanyl-D-alanine carboxypeptidase/D-alanyl-D-alanine-endopeptidase (penicillin-binding protein 4)